MSAAHVFTAPPIPVPAVRIDRIAGVAGLVFALLVGLVNVAIGALAPPQVDASAPEIEAFVGGNTTMLSVSVGVVPIAVVSLYLFLAGAFPRLSAGSSEAAFWARVGAVGLVIVEVMFLTRLFFEVVLIANVERFAAEPALIEVLWQLQGAGMTFTGIGLALGLLGLSRAARLSGVIPVWQERLGLGAALLFVAAAMAIVPTLEGSPIGILGLPAFVAWLVWLALTSLRLLRSDDPSV